MSLEFFVKSDIEINQIRDFIFSSKYNFVFEKPSYWKAVNEIVRGKLYIAYLIKNKEIACWIPFILKTSEKINLVNAMPYYGSHGGPYGPNKNLYNKLLVLFFEYCISQNIDSSFVALSIEASDLLSEEIKRKYLIDKRIGQITHIPKHSINIEDDLFASYHVKTRNAVRKGLKYSNINLTTETEENLLSKIINLHIENISVLNGIPKKLEHFKLLKKFSGTDYKFRMVSYCVDDKIACALISLITATTYEYFTPVLNPLFRESQLLSRLIHNELIYASKINLKYWNWGGTWPSQEGVYRFKSRWGAKSLPYYYLISEKNNKIKDFFGHSKLKFDYMYKFKYS